MQTLKHTAGAWQTVILEGDTYIQRGDSSKKNSGHGLITRVQGGEEKDGNAMLIASAPELRELLSLAVCYVDNEEVKGQIYRLLGKINGVGGL